MDVGLWVGIVGGLVGIAGTVGIVLGQIRRGVVTELRESLKTARDEIDIERQRGDRLDDLSKTCHARIVALESEVAILRQVKIEDGVAEKVAEVLAVEARRQTDEVLRAIEQLPFAAQIKKDTINEMLRKKGLD